MVAAWSLSALALVMMLGPVSARSFDGSRRSIGEAQLTCVRAWSEARYSGSGYDHLVYVASDCVAAILVRHVDRRESRTTSAEHRPRRDGGGADIPRVSGVDVHPLPQLRIEPPLVARYPRLIAPPRPSRPRS